MRVFITGAAGFIGSAVAIELSSAGFQVIAGVRPSRLEQGCQLPGCLMLPWDALNPPQALPECEAVIHCATSNDIVSRSFGDGIDLSVKATQKLLEQSNIAGARRFIFLSTIQVHGTELQGVIDENSPIVCETAYALNHYFGEEVCRMMASSWPELEMTLLRPSNVYGVPSLASVSRSTLVPMCFVKQACNEGKIVMRSSGRQTRNFISTGELAKICKQLLSGEHMPGARPVLAASAWQESILCIAKMTARIHEEIFHRPAPLEILSALPVQGNNFEVNSLIAAPHLSLSESAAEMKATIHSLFHQLSRNPEPYLP